MVRPKLTSCTTCGASLPSGIDLACGVKSFLSAGTRSSVGRVFCISTSNSSSNSSLIDMDLFLSVLNGPLSRRELTGANQQSPGHRPPGWHFNLSQVTRGYFLIPWRLYRSLAAVRLARMGHPSFVGVHTRLTSHPITQVVTAPIATYHVHATSVNIMTHSRTANPTRAPVSVPFQ